MSSQSLSAAGQNPGATFCNTSSSVHSGIMTQAAPVPPERAAGRGNGVEWWSLALGCQTLICGSAGELGAAGFAQGHHYCPCPVLSWAGVSSCPRGLVSSCPRAMSHLPNAHCLETAVNLSVLLIPLQCLNIHGSQRKGR